MYVHYFCKNKNQFESTNSIWRHRQEVGEHSKQENGKDVEAKIFQ